VLSLSTNQASCISDGFLEAQPLYKTPLHKIWNMFKNIYFINTNKLIALIKAGDLTEKLALKYLFLFVLIGGPIGFPVYFEFSEENEIEYDLIFYIVDFLLCGIFTYFGLRSAYTINKNNGGGHFFERLAVFSFPVCIQLTLVFLLLAFATYAGIPDYVWEYNSGIISSFAGFGLDISYTYFFYFMIGRLFRKLDAKDV
jgi:hypothetical protein